jgi:hypothetical protein
VERIELMQGVADKLFAAESTIDSAIADAAVLLSGMVEARKAARVSSTVDAQAHAKVVEAMVALNAARTAMVEAHAEMNEVKLRLGVRTKMVGFDKQKPSGFLEERTPLTVVA